LSLALTALLIVTAAGHPAVPPAVQAVIDRSHATRADYAVILRVQTMRNGVAGVEDDAEYQLGRMHRVEVPATRVLADCDIGLSIIFDVAQAKLMVNQQLGSGACGIAVDADKVITGRMLPPIRGSFGTADVIELIGEKLIRRYAVTPDGIIVSNDWIARGTGTYLLKTQSVRVVRGKLDPKLFKTASLFSPAPPLR